MTQFQESNILFDEVTDISESLSDLTAPVHPTLPTEQTDEAQHERKKIPKTVGFREPFSATLDMSGDESDKEPNVEQNKNVGQDSDLVEMITGSLDGHSDDDDGTEEGMEGSTGVGGIGATSVSPHLTPGSLSRAFGSSQDLPNPDMNVDDEQDEALGDESLSQGGPLGPMEGPQPLPLPQMQSPGNGDDDDDDDDDDVQIPLPEGSYDPRDYEHLDVAPELKELFTYIAKYTPQNIELEYKLRPYIPDYIPAVGDIDAFIKISRPDEETSTAGLTVLDEPSAKQSDSTVLDLQLRAVAKYKTARSVVVKTVENAEKNSKVIEKWMRDISDLHRAKPPPTVHYSKRMPDIDSLMQEWPSEIEELLKEIDLPTGALQVELPHYVDLICSILDIPVYKSRIQSLHVLFTLFSVFKNSSHFRHLAEENLMDNEDKAGGADRLVL